MIKSNTLRNFRGIKELDINQITPLTLITGRNNVGKSSVLESLFLLYDHASADVFGKLSGFRGDYANASLSLWETLFYQMKPENEINISVATDDDTKRTIRYYKDQNYIPSTQLPGPESIGQLLTAVKASYSLGFDYMHGNYRETGHFSAGNMGILLNMETSLEHNEREILPWMLHVSPAAPRMTMDVIDWIGNLEIQGKKGQAVAVLQLLDPQITDIFSASQNGQVQLYIKNHGTALPLKYAGDGMIRLLYLMAAMLSNPNAIILIDEIENGFHYSMYEKLWEMIATVAAQQNCQIIATSHSYELIEAAVLGVKTASREADFSLHRLDAATGVLMDKHYDWEMAAFAAERGIEVR